MDGGLDGGGSDGMMMGDSTVDPDGGVPENCGNGMLNAGETCDDGNTTSNDGCSAQCIREDGWQCPVVGQACERCGDGVIGENERCDDGNTNGDDGCSADCTTIEDFYTCPTPGEACSQCGDGVVGAGEVCDDGNRSSGDGCVQNCSAVEPGFACPMDGGECTECGNGIVETGEGCDDGNFLDNDGCSTQCLLEAGATCWRDGVSCSVCGNGVIEVVAVDDKGTADTADDTYTFEECDDANMSSGDGCSSSCAIEGDYVCPVPGIGCGLCGDGELDDIERCDDGNTNDGDGCSGDCLMVSQFYNCYPPSGRACELCGNGVVGLGEICDDGVDNTLNEPVGGDGCSRDCKRVEDGFTCVEDPDSGMSICTQCGNGILEGGEGCDDGNITSGDGCPDDCSAPEANYNCFLPGLRCEQCGDGEIGIGEECDEGHLATPGNKTAGCDSQCRVVDPWVCPQKGEPCELCGDGNLGTYEDCDDNNVANDDGCSSTCTLEPGFICPNGNCVAAACGDGYRAGQEECDDGNFLSGDGCNVICDVEEGWVCTGGIGCRRTVCGDGVVEGSEECDDAGSASPGCDDQCLFETGYDCPTPGADCIAIVCGDGLAQGSEACDDGNTDLGDGCDAGCQLEPGYYCPVPGDACLTTTCGDGLVQGLEECDDAGATTPGCSDTCTVETFYRCDGEPSECRPIIEFVTVRTFQVSNINPAGLVYDPDRRSFAGHKSQSSQPPVELCFDGTVLDPTSDACTGGNGCAIDSSGTATPLLPSCEVSAEPCYAYPPRPAQSGTLVGAAYDPFTDYYIFLTVSGQTATLTHVPRDFDDTMQSIGDFQVNLTGLGTPLGLTVGEDGDLYVVDDKGTPQVHVFERRRAGDQSITTPDCETTPEANCTGFETAPNAGRGWSVPSDDPLDAIFTVPGETLVGIFNRYTGAPSYTGVAEDGSNLVTSEYFTFYDPTLATDPPLFGRSELPGLLFSISTIGFSYTQEAKAAETAADGGYFIVCPANPSEKCQLFARRCQSDAECAAAIPGTTCNLDAAEPYCNSPGEARDDRYSVDVSSTDNLLDVLANDSLSESACIDPQMKIISIDTTNLRGEIPNFTSGDTELHYDAPDDGSCGFVDEFTYVADLGGGVTDDATVRITVACICGDGVVQSNEECDQGNTNGAYPARCSDECLFNVVCGDGFVDRGEECDDSNTNSGDGCSALCTLETVCGDGNLAGAEACDDGNNVSGDGCNANCTLPMCGDNSLDFDNNEQCDDGNLMNGDGCTSICTIETECGNMMIEGAEECDDGNQIPGDGCSAACTIEGTCGNGMLDAGETCDPAIQATQCGGVTNCTARCFCENYCGDGRIGGTEQCDDGANGPGDGCRDDCTAEVCGDGIVDAGEQCDDGNADPTDGCSLSCNLLSVCGNSKVEPGEECDDGNSIPNDGCSALCIIEVGECGNGTVEQGEECDDGNLDNGDGCDEACVREVSICGNSVIEFGEQCDDGNTVAGDGCSADCRIEIR